MPGLDWETSGWIWRWEMWSGRSWGRWKGHGMGFCLSRQFVGSIDVGNMCDQAFLKKFFLFAFRVLSHPLIYGSLKRFNKVYCHWRSICLWRQRLYTQLELIVAPYMSIPLSTSASHAFYIQLAYPCKKREVKVQNCVFVK